MTGTCGTYYTEEELMEMSEEQTPILYCLGKGCGRTKLMTDPDKEWRVSEIRSMMIKDGYPAHFTRGGFCVFCRHDKSKQEGA